jgi:hypothetical protein
MKKTFTLRAVAGLALVVDIQRRIFQQGRLFSATPQSVEMRS